MFSEILRLFALAWPYGGETYTDAFRDMFSL